MSNYTNVDFLYDAAKAIPLRDHLPGSRSEEVEENESLFPSLSFRQRLIGFACCLGLAFLLSTFAWVAIFIGDLSTFAVINTVANIISIGSTLFLCGPLKQLKRMCDPTRLVATIVYFAAMALTFIAALVLQIALITLATVIVQYIAMIWYCLSYIPFARSAVLQFLRMQ